MKPWYSEVPPQAWRTLAAAKLGWMLDGMDVMLYAFALTTIQKEFGITSAQAGSVASVTLITSTVGGSLAGVLADRIGRVRVLSLSILVYSLFTGLTATAGSLAALMFWRGLVGLGLGAEWSAGSVLVAEAWPAKHRGKAIGLMQAGWAVGYLLAAALAALLLERAGWRWFFVVGAAPAVLAYYVRRRIPEPAVWRAARLAPARGLVTRRLLGSAAFATVLCGSVLFAYWGVFTWLPAYLAMPASLGGAGLDVVRGAAWIVPVQIGAFFGYTLFGFFADRAGRRPVFVIFVLCAAVLVPVYTLWARGAWLLALGPLLGFFGHGYFSVFGALLAELFPSAIRATAQGICYNLGRAVSALAPIVIGAMADRIGIGGALATMSAFFAAGAVLMMRLPETKGEELA